MFNYIKIKQALIERGICEDNEYLEKYLRLLEANSTNTEGELHHVIPLSSYGFDNCSRLFLKNGKIASMSYSVRKRREAAAKEDSANCLVRLPRFPLHFLAHAYFMLCCKDSLVGSNDIIPLKHVDLATCIYKFNTIEWHKFVAKSYIEKHAATENNNSANKHAIEKLDFECPFSNENS